MRAIFLFITLSLFWSCTGLFVNPDLVAGRNAFIHSQRISLSPATPKEDRVYAEISDSSFTRMPEHDFYWMQGRFTDLFLLPFDTVSRPVAEEPYTGQKDITRFRGPEGPPMDPAYFLKIMMNRGIDLYQVTPCPAWVAAAFLKSGTPLLTLGLLQVKRRYRHLDSAGNDTSSTTVFRRLTTFDLLVGFSRMTGPRQHLPGEEDKEEYILEMRSRFNVRCTPETDLTRNALTLYGGHLSGSHRAFDAVYIAVKREIDPSALLDSVRANARRMGFGDSLPPLHRLL